MTTANLIAYAELCSNDPAIRAEFEAMDPADFEARTAHAAALGLPFNRADAEDIARRMQDGELSEKDLDEVSGGFAFTMGLTIAAIVGLTASAAVGIADQASPGWREQTKNWFSSWF